MCKAIYFDLDGTLADLYGVENWEPKLRSHDATPYQEAKPLCDMEKLNNLCLTLAAQGVIIGVISWLAIGSNKQYDKEVRKAKKEWIFENLPCVSEIHLIKYGYPKHYTCKVKEEAILIDDNFDVCSKWTRGETINPQIQNIIEELEKIVRG